MRFYTMSLMIFALLSVVGCASNTSKSSPQENDNKPSRNLIPLKEKATITFTITQGKKAWLTLLNGKNDRSGYLGWLEFDDTDCVLGHKVVLSYRQNVADTYRRYFTKEIPWKTSGTLTIQWDYKTELLTVLLENETISVPLLKSAQFLEVTSEPGTVSIDNITYHPK